MSSLLDPGTGVPVSLSITVQSDSRWGGQVQGEWVERFDTSGLAQPFFLSLPQFGDSEKLRLVRILHGTVMVRVSGGWEPLEEFLKKHDPCRGKNYRYFTSSSSSSSYSSHYLCV